MDQYGHVQRHLCQTIRWAQIGDIEAFMAVGVPGGPQCLDMFLPQKGHSVPGLVGGKGTNASSEIDSDLRL